MKGILYGVGLGPGDPELMTLKADRLIRTTKVIAYPTLAGAESFARSIAAQAIPDDAREIVMDVPMTVARQPAQDAYDAGAAEIRAALDAGENVVCLCEGDPFFYGSFMYLFARLSADYDCQIVPGVTSMTASAAVTGTPLAARNEVLTIIPGPLAEDALEARMKDADSLCIMKVGRHLSKLRDVITRLGLLDQAIYIERATLAAQVTMPLAQAPEKAPYFSMILITKGADPWL
ncbi:precorrin-2 C(20)-methyltransferase [Nereida sp. MMG025]|uniref:precorrin-2 C(20)-methyltransferase n=1 Tax=Nereida sp. MMG025 TaxID=2909981 RepID=UPI001EFFD845|nr:precorrin-2 C(20)-methyltransferase [Nereida sp. MMG025]MCF6444916.1 precorrin-2 C(20)-methyltransferase [Nereida sp. MMG025]